jgi:hypothetical protein
MQFEFSINLKTGSENHSCRFSDECVMSFIDLELRNSRRGHARALLEVWFHSSPLKSGHARVQERLVSCATC